MSNSAPAVDELATRAEQPEGTYPLSELELYARQLAKDHQEVSERERQPELTRHLNRYRELFESALLQFRSADEREELALSFSAEWVLDNDHLVRRALRMIAEDLPRQYYRQLPMLAAGPLEGIPRTYALAREIILFEKGHLDLERVQRYIKAYQTITPLTIGELWSLPVMLRLGIVQCLIPAVSRITATQDAIQTAVLPVIDLSPGTSDDEVVANSFTSLRTLAAQDWEKFFENLSLAEQILTQDPAGVYGDMDFETRDRYRKVVEALAVASERDELEVAAEAIRLAEARLAQEVTKEPFSGAQRTAHVGYYLLERGKVALESRLGYRPSVPDRLRRWLNAHPTPLYLGGSGLLTLLILGLLIGYVAQAGGTPAQFVMAVVLSLVPGMTVAVSLLNWLVTNIVSPRVLPKMDYRDGLPDDCATLVVVPGLLTDVEEAGNLARQLELHFLSSPDSNLYFALLTDFSDAPEQHMPEDDALVTEARQRINALNAKYASETGSRFLLLHRQRRWNPAEEVWMGWERKRGKLEELNQMILRTRGRSPDGSHALAGQESPDRELLLLDTDFTVQAGDLAALAAIRFVITLDSDTILPRDSARRLVAALAHPLNRAEFNPAGEVIAGYTVLQPRTEVNPTSTNLSWFTRIFSGNTGLDLYTLAVSDVYQDLFGEGIYIGKGIYDVAAFERSLAGRVPENALLSHDLFEGIQGRAGLVTDIVLIEDYPAHYLGHTRRMHRWMRGDWQLLPWLFPRVPARGDSDASSGNGKRAGALISFIPNQLSWIDRWKIFDNLRRSLVTPALLLLFVAGWLEGVVLPGSALFWTITGLLSLAVPLLTGSFDALARLGQVGVQQRALGRALSSIRDAALRWSLAVIFLPYEALLALDAILATFVRIFITRRGLLRWTTSAQVSQDFHAGMYSDIAWRQMAPALVLVPVLTLLIVLVSPQALPAAAPLLFVWLVSPAIAHWISRPILYEPEPLTDAQRRELRGLARRTWLFYEQFVGPDDHWLPPDHYQEAPLGAVAHRTSPTNIGLSLLSTLAAYDLGYLDLLNLVARLRTTFDAMESLERYRGHFLNWYDTRTLEPLPPRYVSTVDSGNLAACLLALGQGCLAISETFVLRWETWQSLLDSLHLLGSIFDDLQETDAGAEAVELSQVVRQIHQQIQDLKDQPDVWHLHLLSLTGNASGEGDGAAPKEQRFVDWQALNQQILALVEVSGAAIGAENLRKLRVYSGQARQRQEMARRELETLSPWLISLAHPPTLLRDLDPASTLHAPWRALSETLQANPKLGQMNNFVQEARSCLAELQTSLSALNFLPDLVQEAERWCAVLAERLESGSLATKALLAGYYELYHRAESYLREMDFSFLFDPDRQVFHIGYNLVVGKLDNNYYDLLASEARIASLVAIAKGDIPQSHWLHLGRPFGLVGDTRALLSWSATMFEYLMPSLLLRNYAGTLLHQSSLAAANHQIAYGKEQRVPWGISESGYYRFDNNQFYQYRAFGVPGLGFKRGLADDLVIAPYASLLALPLRPQAVMDNVRHLAQLGMLGFYGLYEAVDFTPARLTLGKKFEIVREYMAHHQGMILLSIANFLCDDVMVQRFHADPRIESVDLLLMEQIPQEAPIEQPHAQEVRATRPDQPRVNMTPWPAQLNSLFPDVHFLSNGSYGALITASGGGYNVWRNIDLTRWRADATLVDWGTWVYVKDLDSGDFWSAGHQPSAAASESQNVYFNAHMVGFRRNDQGISLEMEITVAPDEDVEVRRIVLTNLSNRPRRLSLTSYAEVILADQAMDRRHPAFNKLFIESEYIPEVNGLLFRRRPRSGKEEPVYLVHSLVVAGDEQELSRLYESDRARFLGRGKTVRAPQALTASGWLSRTQGATLDPVMSLGQVVTLEPHQVVSVAFLTLAASTRKQALRLAGHYQAWHTIDHTFDLARSLAEIELLQLGYHTQQLEPIQRLLSALLYPNSTLRAGRDILAANRKGQPGLWTYAISGDYPILLVCIEDSEELPLVQDILKAHVYWRNRGIKIDLVLLNEQGTDYGQELSGLLRRLLERMQSDAWVNRRGGIFLLLADQLSAEDRLLLETAARAILNAGHGPLAEQLAGLGRLPARLPAFFPMTPADRQVEATPPVERPSGLLFENGLGGFSSDGREYVIYLEPDHWTPAPWINVIANPDFGFLATETGLGYTWAANSGENRLTPWNNDPVSDPPGEVLYLRDEETSEVWSPTPLPARAPSPYLVRHGAGYSIFEHHSHGLKQHLRLFAPLDAPVKIIQLRLENIWSHDRRITVTYFAEWVLGSNRELAQQYVVPEFEGDHQALLARNPYNIEFGERVAFAAASKPLHGLTTDRTEFLGRMGSKAHPAALARIGLGGTVEPGLDPCAALQLHIDLEAGGVDEIYFLLGQGEDRQDALRLVTQYQDVAEVESAWESMGQFWNRTLGTITVQTPDRAMDLLLNRWLLYQALACRIWGRSAFYQSSGAYGFRDQLQDVMSLVFAAPELTRAHLLRAARHQFDAGDVLHWWHPPAGRGVRTRFSDDLLWLPFVTAHYVLSTGDEAVLDEKVPFVQGSPLEVGEDERYGLYPATGDRYTLYEHCRRALEKGATSGAHNLPLIGSGDWNDGMNRVGIEGRGESIWLGWFLVATLKDFATLCECRGNVEQATAYRQRAAAYVQALEDNGWDGEWYLRAFYDDGTPLGSRKNRECQIDAIAQSWAVTCGEANQQRVIQAMQSVSERLVRPEEGLILLFTPPFNRTPRDPGYIKGYLPGIRENGGQYTHAALWTIWAFAELGQGDTAVDLFRLINPIYHGDTRQKVDRYKVEPYVIAADVYGVPPHTGRGGWTWYTGSSGWMYRLGVEALLGLRKEGQALIIDPCIPRDWPEYLITYRDRETVYEIKVENPAGVNRGVQQVLLDGVELPEAKIPLENGADRRQVRVILG